MRPLLSLLMLAGPTRVRHVSVVPPSRADALTAAVYRQLKRDFGLIAPPVSLHSASPRVLAACWSLLRETLVVSGRVNRGAKEAVATGVSAGNACGYCVEIHRAATDVLAGTTGEAFRPLADWARSTAEPGRLAPAPCAASDSPEILGTAITFHYLNRMVEIFLPPSSVPAAAPAGGRRAIIRTLAGAMVRDATPASRGASPGLLADAPLPVEFEWAKSEPSVAGALAGAIAAIDDAATRVSAPVREVVEAEVADRAGAPPALGRGWLSEATTRLPAPDRPVARLALLVALAAPRVTDDDIAAFRALHPEDGALIEVAAWAAMTAARNVAHRLPPRPHTDHPVPTPTQ
ncbi:alkylhydroperoxidase [Streptomyces sp. ST2-7A]|uniref:alkylhydroperoxidase n=1 Tax=Streptomyces sp. ST2-7A TaxID=2907214 RepID=UPI001F3F6C53|nr:alkylhydroperoxidase [Streptomyces sp. ST2-7A]MCE7079511.1 alkylhydroperoxidase [Streptomyces sp. ST2-7A]